MGSEGVRSHQISLAERTCLLQPHNKSRKYALIIGAGPAGLTAAYELLTRTDILPIVLEKSDDFGGLSRTVNYKGNRIDVGGHRFFSKSERVTKWWLQMLPLQSLPEPSVQITYRGQATTVASAAEKHTPSSESGIMLIRDRKSRIYFRGKLFEYPISFTGDTLRKLGLAQTIKIGLSYTYSRLFPISIETNFEQFLINRFGRQLYRMFFEAYTEKVWGVSCREISALWGRQRIKRLSLTKIAAHSLRKYCRWLGGGPVHQEVETSLIERFMYPKLGPGQMWEEVARRVNNLGGKVLKQWCVDGIEHVDGCRITAVHATNLQSGAKQRFEPDYVFSSMPVKELVSAMSPAPPHSICEVAGGLMYRDFITVGILCSRLMLREPSGETLKDNWIYIQDPDVKVGRLQIFNNWSSAMAADSSTVWIGLEYFCNETDDLWQNTDQEMIDLAKRELDAMKILDPKDILDATVIRAPKAYPAYYGSYDRFSEISSWSDQFKNLFLIGRNGMHRYNNQDHSMLAAMVAVDNILGHISSRANLWALNTEQEYQEERQSPMSSVA
jgi:protoporphyrinogen oxidase